MTKYQILHNFMVEIILRKTIREGLLLALPLVIVGAIGLTLRSIPIPSYQLMIQTLLDGKVYAALNLIFTYTFSILPLILIFTMSFSFGKAVSHDLNEILYYPIITFCSYLIFFEAPNTLSFFDIFSTAQTFTSMIITISACSMLYVLRQWKFSNLQRYLKNPTNIFTSIYEMLIPCLIVLLFFSISSLVFEKNFKDMFVHLHLMLFEHLGINTFSFSLYVLIEHLYWFVGIHGSNVLAGITNALLEPLMAKNILDVANGVLPTELYTPTFLSSFIWLGGSGSVMCLIISIFCFAKNSNTQRIAKFSFLPCIFNISEIIVIGLPVICNPIFLIPFLTVPLICLIVSSIAMQLELVPVAAHAVEWTTPIFLSGYLTTGSIAGTILQIFTLILGVLIYKPFILRYEKDEAENFKNRFTALVNEVIACEKMGKSPTFFTDHELTETVRVLTFDLQQAIKNKELHLYYQPQVHYDGTIYGAEALLRWNHPRLGFVYPPLIIFLANEHGLLDELGLSLIEKACGDLQQLSKEIDHPIKISVNVSPPQLYNQLFCNQVYSLLQKYDFGNSVMAFELTEQIALSGTIEIMDRLHTLKKMGILLSMDDFGMGHSSVMYLQDSEFDIVKLDGSLIKKFLTSDRSVDIITAITQLSQKFQFKVVAEYVETIEQREKLALLGCYIYQGWLYSPAIPLTELVVFIKNYELSAQNIG